MHVDRAVADLRPIGRTDGGHDDSVDERGDGAPMNDAHRLFEFRLERQHHPAVVETDGLHAQTDELGEIDPVPLPEAQPTFRDIGR